MYMGLHMRSRKKSSLGNLPCFVLCDVPYIAGGDFNIIRFSNEKNKFFIFDRFSGMFNSVIQTYDLSEIIMSGGGYTWSNNHKDLTLEKLDIVLSSKIGKLCFLKYVFISSLEISLTTIL
jgi:hypothetical protein